MLGHELHIHVCKKGRFEDNFSSLCACHTEAHHKSLCWDTQNGKWTSYSWRMFDFNSTLGIYTVHISLLGAQREYQSTGLCYFILALSELHTLLTWNTIIKNGIKTLYIDVNKSKSRKIYSRIFSFHFNFAVFRCLHWYRKTEVKEGMKEKAQKEK